MGLFERAGRQFEQFKREVTAAAEERAEYVCESCGAALYTHHEQCPECGDDAVVPVETDAADASE